MELATIILGDKEVARGTLLEKSRRESTRKTRDEAEKPQCSSTTQIWVHEKVGKSQNDGWLRCVRESGKMLRYLRKQVYGGGFRVALQILLAVDHKACYDRREQASLIELQLKCS